MLRNADIVISPEGHYDGQLDYLDTLEFARNLKNVYVSYLRFTFFGSLNMVRDMVQQALPSDMYSQFTMRTLGSVEIEGFAKFDDQRMMLIQIGSESKEGYLRSHIDANRTIHITIRGRQKDVLHVEETVGPKFQDFRLPQVDWYYLQSNRLQVQNLFLDKPDEVHNEFYPWLDTPIDEFYQEYIDDSANVLLLLGPPGTGKTSFVRNLIYRQKLRAAMSFDAQVLDTDDFYVNFMTNTKHDVLVIEDADLFITSREGDANQKMSRLLNVSDGLIKDSSKKLVLSANLTKYDSIDRALIRPGRCFRVLDFRKLTNAEAKLAADKVGIEFTNNKPELALSEIFQSEEETAGAIKRTKMGFI